MVNGPTVAGFKEKPHGGLIIKNFTGILTCAAAGVTPAELTNTDPVQVVKAVSVGNTTGLTVTVKVAVLPILLCVTASQLAGPAVTPPPPVQLPAAKLEAPTAEVRLPMAVPSARFTLTG